MSNVNTIYMELSDDDTFESYNDVNALAVDEVVIKPKSQRLVKFRPTNHNRLISKNDVLLEGVKCLLLVQQM